MASDFTCANCRRDFDTRKPLPSEHVRRYISPEHYEVAIGAFPVIGWTCGTICPYCGFANDAPGFIEGDDIPHICEDGVVISSTRYLPPQPIIEMPHIN